MHLALHPAMLIPVLVLAFAAAAWACMNGEPPSHDQLLGKPNLTISDAEKQLRRTRVVGALEAPHQPGTSLLWCSTMQLAWNELAETMNGGPGPLRVDGDCPLADRLNASVASRDDLDPGSFVAMAGFGQDGILEKIKAALKEKFSGAASPGLLPASVPPGEILAYAYLFKNLEFPEPFLRRKVALRMGDTDLKSFGLWNEHGLREWGKLAKQIEILAYESPSRWAAELRTKVAEDRVIVARLEPGATLADTVKAALAMKTAEEPLRFENSDTLIVPLMNFDVTRSYSELTGRTLTGTKASGTVSYAKQNIRLRLDERGAILKSEAAIGVTSAPVRRDPKTMICDGPFLLLFARRGAEAPYFAMWVENPELLERWK